MENRKIGSRWLCFDTLTVRQAAVLIEGYDPNSVDCSNDNFSGVSDSLEGEALVHIRTVFRALTQSIKARKLQATIRHDARLGREVEYSNDAEVVLNPTEMNQPKILYRKAIDWGKSTVSVEALKQWLSNKLLKPEFFFPEEQGVSKPNQHRANILPPYLDPGDPRFSKKLFATVQAWQTVTESGKKSPKQELVSWLSANAKVLGLMHAGKMSVEAVNDCAKVANWEIKGGAPSAKTRTGHRGGGPTKTLGKLT